MHMLSPHIQCWCFINIFEIWEGIQLSCWVIYVTMSCAWLTALLLFGWLWSPNENQTLLSPVHFSLLYDSLLHAQPLVNTFFVIYQIQLILLVQELQKTFFSSKQTQGEMKKMKDGRENIWTQAKAIK